MDKATRRSTKKVRKKSGGMRVSRKKETATEQSDVG